jgi:GT2 family glycosyltransferase
MSKLSLAILITNYNTWDLTERCVQHCYCHDEGHFNTLLVYDDCSQTEFKGSFPDSTRIYRGRPNVGLAKAYNIGFGLISEDIVIVFDSDAYPTTPFCEEVKQMFENDPSLGLVGFQTIGREGNSTESYTTEPNIWSLLLGQALYARMDRWLADRSERISLYSCTMAVRKAAYLELHGFDENYDFLDIDNDFSLRINRSHWKIALAPGPRIVHEGRGSPQLTRHRVIRFYKSRWYLLRKFHRLPMKRLVKMLILLRLCAEYLILLSLGSVLFRDKSVRDDKIQGRRELIQFFLGNSF